MGLPIAVNLARAGHSVCAWNRTATNFEQLTKASIRVCPTPADAASTSEILISLLSDGPVTDTVLFEQGAANSLPPGAVVVMMSSIPVDTARAQASRLSSMSIRYVDAPVSGGTAGAERGDLSIMIGGDGKDVREVAPILQALGRLTHVGPVGAGQLAKLANQLIVGVTIGAVAEALLLAEAGGADPGAVRAALLGGFADSAVLRQHGERMLERRFDPGAKATTQLKDLRTARILGEQLGLVLPYVARAEGDFLDMAESDLADRDHSALFLALRRRSRVFGDRA